MSRCENPNCNKDNLRKADVEFDEDRKMVLCHGCYALVHPGWLPPEEIVDLIPREKPEFKYEISLSKEQGLKARVAYGELAVSVHAPMDELKRYLGVEVADADESKPL